MKNWKTTLIGAALAGLSFIAIYQQNGGNLADWKQWAIPALLAVFGYLAKDAGITGTLKLTALSLLLFPACSTTADNARLSAVVDLALNVAQRRGAITAQEAADVRAAKEIAIAPTSAKTPSK